MMIQKNLKIKYKNYKIRINNQKMINLIKIIIQNNRIKNFKINMMKY